MLSIVLGIIMTIVSYIKGVTVNQTAEHVFSSFMYLTAALSGLNIGNKYVDIVKYKSEKDDDDQGYNNSVNNQYNNNNDAGGNTY